MLKEIADRRRKREEKEAAAIRELERIARERAERRRLREEARREKLRGILCSFVLAILII